MQAAGFLGEVGFISEKLNSNMLEQERTREPKHGPEDEGRNSAKGCEVMTDDLLLTLGVSHGVWEGWPVWKACSQNEALFFSLTQCISFCLPDLNAASIKYIVL